MDANLNATLGMIGAAAVQGLAAVGSGLGSGAAGMAACGAWKRCYARDRAAPFLLTVFIGAPLTQTIYGFILMRKFAALAAGAAAIGITNCASLMGAGVFGGLAIGVSAWMQGVTGAAAADAMGETGKGFGNYMVALGMTESVALFVLVFMLITVK